MRFNAGVPVLLRDLTALAPALALGAALGLPACSDDAAGADPGGGGETSEGEEEDPGPPPEITCQPLEGDDFPEVDGRNDPGAHYFAAPWPSDERKSADGNIDVASFPNPGDVDFFRNYLDVIGGNTDAWSANAAIFLPFTGPLHPDSLPANAAATMGAHATVYLEPVDSPGASHRVPLHIRWQPDETPFLPGNVLIAVPVDGHVLREATTYRAVATDRLLDARCRPVASGAQAVFTTQRFIAPMERIREVVHEQPEPRIAGLRQLDRDEHVFAYEGTVGIPLFQRGQPPYTSEGGDIVWDEAGRPVVQETVQVRVVLAVPRSDMPRSGWPLVIVSHGTGGDYQSFLRDGSAQEMAQVGLASLGFDQVVHGDRVPPNSIGPELAFVNLNNILAARDNMRQGAADGFQLMRLARKDGGIAVKLDLTFSSSPTYTDPHRVMFLGHSQGAITGAPFVALEPDLLGAVFSGAGAVLRISLYERTDPVDFHQLAKQFLGLNALAVDVQLDKFHPVSALLQTFIDPADSVNYAPYFLKETSETKGWATNVFVVQGITDAQVVPNSGVAFIAAAGVDLAEPALLPIEAMELRDQLPKPLPFRKNVGGVTGGAAQFPGDHFVLYDDLSAGQKVYRFLETAADDDAVVAR